jgi:hypothetical protein
MVECDVVHVSIEAQEVVIAKEKQYMNPEGLVNVGRFWGAGVDGEGGRRWLATPLWSWETWRGRQRLGRTSGCNYVGNLCAGLNSWSLLLVASSWDWLLLYAIVGMQASLLAIIAIPLLFSWWTRRPGVYITPGKWKTLILGETVSALSRRHEIPTQVATKGVRFVCICGSYCLIRMSVLCPFKGVQRGGNPVGELPSGRCGSKIIILGLQTEIGRHRDGELTICTCTQQRFLNDYFT